MPVVLKVMSTPYFIGVERDADELVAAEVDALVGEVAEEIFAGVGAARSDWRMILMTLSRWSSAIW